MRWRGSGGGAGYRAGVRLIAGRRVTSANAAAMSTSPSACLAAAMLRFAFVGAIGSRRVAGACRCGRAVPDCVACTEAGSVRAGDRSAAGGCIGAGDGAAVDTVAPGACDGGASDARARASISDFKSASLAMTILSIVDPWRALVGRRQSMVSRNASASSAAMQPVPADVTACR